MNRSFHILCSQSILIGLWRCVLCDHLIWAFIFVFVQSGAISLQNFLFINLFLISTGALSSRILSCTSEILCGTVLFSISPSSLIHSDCIPVGRQKVFILQPENRRGDCIEPYKEGLIKVLVESKALEFGSFKLKSGRMSPYFINMARALGTGEFATQTAQAYTEEIHQTLEHDFDYIHGPAYKGIPLAALVSAQLYDQYSVNKRWGYDRKEIKAYGDLTEKVIVGDLRDNDTVLMIDDVITTGGTKIENWEKLTAFKKNLTCKGILIAVDREEKEESGEPVSQYLQEKGFNLFSIMKITEIFSYLYKNPVNGRVYVDEKIRKAFDAYFAEYGG